MPKDRAIFYIAVAQTIVWAGLYYVFPALLVHWEKSFAWSKTNLTMAITGALFLSALFAPVAGRLIDAGRGALMMACAAGMGSFALFSLSFIMELWQFYLLWAVVGMSFAGCLYDPCFAIITRARGGNARKAIVWITLVAGFAGTISFPTAHMLVGEFGWRTTVQIFAVIVLVVGVPLIWRGISLVERDATALKINEQHPTSNRHEFLHRPVFWFLAFAFAFTAMTHGMTLHHLVPLLYERDISLDLAVLAASFIGPMQVAGRLVMVAVESRVSNHGVTIGCFTALGGSIFCLIAADSTYFLIGIFVILFGGGYGMVSIIRPIITRDLLGGNHFGAKSGALSLPYQLGAAMSPFVGSIVWRIGGYDLVLKLLAVLITTGMVMYLLANASSRKT